MPPSLVIAPSKSTSPAIFVAPDTFNAPAVTVPATPASPPTVKSSVSVKSSATFISLKYPTSHLALELPKSLVPEGIKFESTTPLIVTVSDASLPQSTFPSAFNNPPARAVIFVNSPAGADTVCPLA